MGNGLPTKSQNCGSMTRNLQITGCDGAWDYMAARYKSFNDLFFFKKNTKTFDKPWWTWFSPVWIFPLLFWWVNQTKINNVSKYQVFVWFHFFKFFKEKDWYLQIPKQEVIFSKIWNNYVWNLKNIWNQTKNSYLLTLFDLIWFAIQKRRGKIQTGENHVHQGLSKVFVFYTYPRLSTIFEVIGLPQSICRFDQNVRNVMNPSKNLGKLVLCSILSYWSHKLSLILRGVRRELSLGNTAAVKVLRTISFLGGNSLLSSST